MEEGHPASAPGAAGSAARAVERLERLLEITRALSQARTAEDVMSALLLEADRAFGVSSAVGYVRRGERFELVAAMGRAEDARDRLRALPSDGGTPTARAALDGAPRWLESPAAVAAVFPGWPARVPHAARFGAVAALPLRLGDGVIGAVGLAFDAPRTFSADDRALLTGAAEQCAVALDRARLLDAEHDARQVDAASRALLDAVIENAPLGIGFLDPELRFRRLNRALAELNGVPVEEHLGRTVRELLPGLAHDEVEAAWREVLRTGRPIVDVEVGGETPAAPGVRRTWLESWYPVRSGDEVLGVGALVREVTGERAAQEFQRNVLGVVGHDLRNPLAAVATGAQLLVRSERLPPELARIAGRILSNARRMERIIAVLLDYARVRGAEPMPLRRSACRVAALVGAAADDCEATHPGRAVRRSGPPDLSAWWDPDRISQVLVNLVGNALDYSPPGSEVELVWAADGEDAVVTVENEGPPIPAESLPTLFEPFRRGERERAGGRDGLGLGLFIARAIARAHGGDLAARSGGGERTRFTLRLPRALRVAAEPGAAPSPEQPAA